jgi:hypothetical protein
MRKENEGIVITADNMRTSDGLAADEMEAGFMVSLQSRTCLSAQVLFCGIVNVRFDATALRGRRDIVGGAAQTLVEIRCGRFRNLSHAMFECSIARGMAEMCLVVFGEM